jgi:hypothetical protein
MENPNSERSANMSGTQHTACQRGVVDYWDIGNGVFFARDDYKTATFTPPAGAGITDIKSLAYAALGREVGDIQREALGRYVT